MDGEEPGRGGLRERKKEQTRAALSWAAIRLTIEHGWDQVRVDDIAAEVGVSGRTFNNYFAGKADAIAGRHLDRVRAIGDALTARPADEPLWDALHAAVTGQFSVPPDGPTGRRSGSEPEDQWVAGIRLMAAEPALQREIAGASAAGEAALAAAVAERTGTDAERDLYPRLVAGTVMSVIQVATRQWSRADPPVPIGPLLGDALRQLSAGLPIPATTSVGSKEK